MAKQAGRQTDSGRRPGGVWDLAPLVVLAGAGVALLQPDRRSRSARLDAGVSGSAAAARAAHPGRRWQDILIRTKNEFVQDNIAMISAGVSFYTLLALFPGIAAFVALYGLFADVAEARRHLQILSFLLTPEMLQLIGDQMIRVAAANKGGQSVALLVSVLLSIWSANGAVKSMMTGLNIAYDERETRSFVRKTLTSLAFTLGFLTTVVAAVGLLAAQPVIATFMGQRTADLYGWVSRPILLAVMILGLALLYRFGPSREFVRWRWITWGSVAVVLWWVAMSALFALYVDNFGHFNKTYGSLGAMIGLMIWLYLSALVVLVGAELNAEIERQSRLDALAGR
jgi:membrane protein